MRNRTEIHNNILGVEMEPEGNKCKNVRGKKDENDTNIERFVQYNVQEQKRENKITSGAIRQIQLPQLVDKRSISVSNGTHHHKAGSDADILQLNRVNITRLLGRKRSRNDMQRQGNLSYQLQATPYRASLQEDARSGNLDTFRQHNSSLRYQQMESEGIPDRKNKTSILSGEKIQTTDHNNPHPKKIELNDRFTLETMQIGRLRTEGWKVLDDLQDIVLHATDRHIRNTEQQTNQQQCNSGSQRSGDTLLQR
ncbi:MAG: hypothetical protein EZS28_040942, partial [Streblomastix strix]